MPPCRLPRAAGFNPKRGAFLTFPDAVGIKLRAKRTPENARTLRGLRVYFSVTTEVSARLMSNTATFT